MNLCNGSMSGCASLSQDVTVAVSLETINVNIFQGHSGTKELQLKVVLLPDLCGASQLHVPSTVAGLVTFTHFKVTGEIFFLVLNTCQLSIIEFKLV